MRICLFIGFLRGCNLLRRMLDRREALVGVFVFDEDAHERVKYADQIEKLCQAHSIPVKRIRKLRKEHLREIADLFRPDVIFCCGWRMLIPAEGLSVAPRGIVAAHDSLLPRLRGFAPTNWSLILGDEDVGVSLFQMTPNVDEGEIYFQQSIPVHPDDTLEPIVERIAAVAVGLFEKYLDAVQADALVGFPQDHARATYTCARTPSDGEIDWTATTAEIVRLVRATADPGPGAFTYHNRCIIKVLKAAAVDLPLRYEGRIPGRIVAVIDGAVDVLTGDGIVRIAEIDSEIHGRCSPASIVKGVRDGFGIRPCLEIAHLHSVVAALESQVSQLLERITKMEHGPAGQDCTNGPSPGSNQT